MVHPIYWCSELCFHYIRIVWDYNDCFSQTLRCCQGNRAVLNCIDCKSHENMILGAELSPKLCECFHFKVLLMICSISLKKKKKKKKFKCLCNQKISLRSFSALYLNCLRFLSSFSHPLKASPSLAKN